MTALPTRGAALAQALFHPRSIAIVGASDDPGKNAGRPLHFLRQAGCAATIYPVNPRRAEVQGEKAWPSLAALPEVPDHVYLVTPTETVIATVAECARLGVKVVSVLASGFSETGAEGAARERRTDRHRPAHRHPHPRPELPGHDQPARAAGADGQCRLCRARRAGRRPVRRLAQRQHDRRAGLARTGARRRLRRPGVGRQRVRPEPGRDLRRDAGRRRHRRLRAVPGEPEPRGRAARVRDRSGPARQAGGRVQTGPLGRRRGNGPDPYRRAGRRGRHRRRLPEGLRHCPRRHPGSADGMPPAGRAPAAAPRPAGAAPGGRRHHHRRRGRDGGGPARHPRHRRRSRRRPRPWPDSPPPASRSRRAASPT